MSRKIYWLRISKNITITKKLTTIRKATCTKIQKQTLVPSKQPSENIHFGKLIIFSFILILMVGLKQTFRGDFFRNQTFNTAWCSFRCWFEWSLAPPRGEKKKYFPFFFQNDVRSRCGRFCEIFLAQMKA